MILLNDNALKCDFFILIWDQAPKSTFQLGNKNNDTAPWLMPCGVATIRVQGSSQSRWLWTTFMDVGLKQNVQLLPKRLQNAGKFCPKQKLSRTLNFFPFYYHVFQTAWGGRKGVFKTKPDMQQSAVEGPLCWSHCSASELMLCFPNKSQVVKE